MVEFGFVVIEIGIKETIKELQFEPIIVFNTTLHNSPNAKFMFTVGGYDDDSRELWQIPEVMNYVRIWAKAAGITYGRSAFVRERLHEETIALLVLSGAFGDDHPFKVEHKG